jgi:hypothetical protein
MMAAAALAAWSLQFVSDCGNAKCVVAPVTVAVCDGHCFAPQSDVLLACDVPNCFAPQSGDGNVLIACTSGIDCFAPQSDVLLACSSPSCDVRPQPNADSNNLIACSSSTCDVFPPSDVLLDCEGNGCFAPPTTDSQSA